MLKLGKVTKVMAFFLALVFVFNFDLFKFLAAILEKGLLNLSKSGFLSEEGHSGCNSQNIAIRILKGNVLCQIWFKWTY